MDSLPYIEIEVSKSVLESDGVSEKIHKILSAFTGLPTEGSELYNPSLALINDSLLDSAITSYSHTMHQEPIDDDKIKLCIRLAAYCEPKSDISKELYNIALEKNIANINPVEAAAYLAEFGMDELMTRLSIEKIIDSKLPAEEKAKRLMQEAQLYIPVSAGEFLHKNSADIKPLQSFLIESRRDVIEALAELPELQDTKVKFSNEDKFIPIKDKSEERIWTKDVISQNLGGFSMNLN